MPRSLLPSLLFLTLLSGCHGQSDTPAQSGTTAATEQPVQRQTPQPNQHTLSGVLLGAQPGMQLEVALLAVDTRGEPSQLIDSVTLVCDATRQPFRLNFDPAQVRLQPLELRARGIRLGQLALHLPPLAIANPTHNLDLGALRLQPAP